MLANENIASSVIAELRQLGHDVLWAKESLQGEPDSVLLARAQAETRILLTHDKDFGELAFREGCPAECGIILIRLCGEDPQSDKGRVIEVLTSREDSVGHFSVVESERIRMRLLAPPPKPK
nr:DUF5615 family PIN-like protein [Aeoliella straminimaris]